MRAAPVAIWRFLKRLAFLKLVSFREKYGRRQNNLVDTIPSNPEHTISTPVFVIKPWVFAVTRIASKHCLCEIEKQPLP